MNEYRKFIIAILLCSLSTAAISQNLNKLHAAAVDSICKHADIVQIEKKQDYTEIEFLCNGVAQEVGIDNSGKILYIETMAETDEIPFEIIQKKIDKKYNGWLIDEFSIIQYKDTSFIKAEIIKNGIEENIFFTLDGKWYKPKNYIAHTEWNIEKLASSSYLKSAPYNFLNPTSTHDLPDILREISGISLKSDSQILCIQDELGIVFTVNLKTDDIQSIFRFTDLGDFEDITAKGDTVFVLRSDGTIFWFNIQDKNSPIYSKTLQLQSLNLEGLFYDDNSKKLIIASKSETLGQAENERHIYTFDLHTNSQPQKLLTINTTEIQSFVNKQYGSIVTIDFNPSAISIHPLTKELYILSALDRSIAVYKNQKLQAVYMLPAELYFKPEGIAFTPTGDLLLSSEGMKNRYVGGQIYTFKKQ